MAPLDLSPPIQVSVQHLGLRLVPPLEILVRFVLDAPLPLGDIHLWGPDAPEGTKFRDSSQVI